MLYEKNRLPKGNVSCIAWPPRRSTAALHYSHTGSSLPDQILWDAFKKGDELAFTRIYNNYSALLYSYGCKYSSDKEMVRDCLQDFFIYLRQNRLGFAQTNSIKLYLLKAFRRRVMEYLRKSSTRMPLNRLPELCDADAGIEAIYINRQMKAEQMEKLNRALGTLDGTEQKAIYYFYFKGLSYEQIAGIFKFSHVSSARRVMYRSLRQLRNFF
jgi:RNA polymerase sigma factor (sigma-70 family)